MAENQYRNARHAAAPTLAGTSTHVCWKVGQTVSISLHHKSCSGPAVPQMIATTPQIPVGISTDLLGSLTDLPLPTHRKALALLESYFRTVNRLLPIYDKSHYLTLLRAQYRNGGCNSVIVWASLNAVFALGSAYSSRGLCGRAPLSRTYFQQVTRVLNQILLSEPTLLSIQTLLTTAIFLLKCRDHHASRLLVSAAMRFCQSLRFHAHSTVKGLPVEIRESQERAFWVTFILDQSIALIVGHMPTQDPNDMDVDLPKAETKQPIDQLSDEQLQDHHFRQLAGLAVVRCRVSRQLYSEAGLHKSKSDLDHNIRHLNGLLALWKSHNPFLSSHQSLRSNDDFAFMQRLTYCNTLILVNQRYLSNDPVPLIDSEQQPLVIQLCIEAAWDSIDLSVAAVSTGADCIGLTADYMLFAARTLSNLLIYRSNDLALSRFQVLLAMAQEHIRNYLGPPGSFLPDIYSHLTIILLRLAHTMSGE